MGRSSSSRSPPLRASSPFGSSLVPPGVDIFTYPAEQAGDIGNSPANNKIGLVAQIFQTQVFDSAIHQSGLPDNGIRDPDLFGDGIYKDEL